MSITWLEPWSPVERPEDRTALEAELRLELSMAHPMFRLPAVALAKRQDQDDVLFGLDDGRVAEVHLTWRRNRENDARWPRTTIFESADAWIEDRMKRLHADLGAAP